MRPTSVNEESIPLGLALGKASGWAFRQLPLFVLLIGLFLTWQIWLSATQQAERKVRDYFDFRVREAITLTEQRMLAQEQVLRGVQGLFQSEDQAVTRTEFRDYIASQHLEDNFPGIQGVGFALIVPPSQKDRHIASVHMEGFQQYAIRPEGARELYTSIVYLEPFYGRNLRAFGYDMYSEPVRRAAMEQARDSGQAALSGKLRLVQETEKDVQAGFLMYLPVYRNGAPHGTVAERRTNIVGWVYSPFRMNDLAQGIYGERVSDLDIEIYDGGEATPDSLMYDTTTLHEERDLPNVSGSLQITVAGHIWTVLVHPMPGLKTRLNPGNQNSIVYEGVATSLLLALLAWLLITGRERAIGLARDMNRELVLSEERAKLAIEASHTAIWDYDLVTGKVSLSEGWSHLRGGNMEPTICTIQELSGLMPEEEREPVRESIVAALKGLNDSSYRTIHRVRKFDGDYLWILSEGRVVERDGNDRALRMVGTNRDITERIAAEEALRKLSTAVEQSPASVVITDTGGNIQYVNPRFTEVTGYRADEAIGQNPRLLKSGQTPIEVYRELWHHISHGQAWIGELLNRRKSGDLYWEETHISPVFDKTGTITHYVAMKIDITERKRAEEMVRHMAHYDTLTGLPNRALFSDRLQRALAMARRDKSRLAIIFLDLDKFKPINDTLGHQVGDLLLKEAAQRMFGCVRESDTVGRIGGDEFVVLLPEIGSEQDALLVAEKIREALNTPFHLAGNELSISTSGGIAIYPEHGEDETQLIKNADYAMYLAKEAGRNDIRLFGADSSEADET